MTRRIFRTIFIVALFVMGATLILTSVLMFEYFSIIKISENGLTIWQMLIGVMIPLLIIAAITIAISLFVASRTSKRIVQPLNEVNLDDPLSATRYPEIEPLLTRLAIQQSELKKAAQIRQDFTSNVSHELKTPLHAVSGYAELLKNGLVNEEDKESFYEKIYTESQRMSRLVEDIMELSHLDSGAANMVREKVDICMIARNAVDSLGVIAEEAEVELSLSHNAESIVINGISTLIYEIVYNLCDNGIKYNHKGGKVEVNITETEDKVELSVKDNGQGIPAANQSRIFERFYRVDKSRSKEVGGTGLGLSIVKHAAELNNAEISLESKVGKGTKITVVFSK